MPLSKSALKANILAAFSKIKASPGPGSAPLMSKSVADELARAYHKYATSASAGPLTIIKPGLYQSLSGPLSAVPLFLGWGPGLLAYWTPVSFAGPGFIPLNPVIATAVVGVTADIALLLPPNPTIIKTENEFADKFATILDRWTKKMIVTATTTSTPPVVSTLPIV